MLEYQIVDGSLGRTSAHFAEETVVGDQQQRAPSLGRAEPVGIRRTDSGLPLGAAAQIASAVRIATTLNLVNRFIYIIVSNKVFVLILTGF